MLHVPVAACLEFCRNIKSVVHSKYFFNMRVSLNAQHFASFHKLPFLMCPLISQYKAHGRAYSKIKICKWSIMYNHKLFLKWWRHQTRPHLLKNLSKLRCEWLVCVMWGDVCHYCQHTYVFYVTYSKENNGSQRRDNYVCISMFPKYGCW